MKGSFKTAYLQREVVLDVTLAAAVEVGDVVTVSAAGALTIKAGNTVAVGDYIVAQSDQTMEYGHVPVENRDYRYNPAVAASATKKKVALFRINDVDDIIVKVA